MSYEDQHDRHYRQTIGFGPRPLPDPIPRRGERAWLYFGPLMLLLAGIAGAVIALNIDDNRPVAEDKSFVNIKGHDGEVLVVESSTEPIEVRWCQQDDHACHGMVG